MNNIKIGQFGLGCVGEGLFDIVNSQSEQYINFNKICIKDINKVRSAPKELLTNDPEDIFEDSEINLIIELINDANEAFEIVSRAIKKGIPVISANKKMVAVYYTELQKLISTYNTPLLYEGAVCGAIPILRTLETYYQYDQITKVEGIFNGTTNYILTKQYEEDLPFEVALKNAQDKGFAEAEPSSDIDGLDPKYKLKILLAHSFGIDIPVDQIVNFGIRHISQEDIIYAKNKGLKYRLISRIIKDGDEVSAFVSPILVREEDLSYKINNENNYVSIDATYTGNQLLYGKGAGSYPTGMAVFSDITGIKDGFSYRKNQKSSVKFTNEVSVEIFVSARDSEALNEVPFQEAYQLYESKGYFYKTGKALLKDLKQVNSNEIFIGLTSNQVEFIQNKNLVLN